MRHHLFLNSMCNLVKINQTSFLLCVPCQYFLAPVYIAYVGGHSLVDLLFKISFNKSEKSAFEKHVFSRGGENSPPLGG